MNQDQMRENLLLNVRHWAAICRMRASSWAQLSRWLQIGQFMGVLAVYALLDRPGVGWLCLAVLALLAAGIAIDPCAWAAENAKIEGAMYERAIALASAARATLEDREIAHQAECNRVQKMNRLDNPVTGD